jgi:hypothetical protein
MSGRMLKRKKAITARVLIAGTGRRICALMASILYDGRSFGNAVKTCWSLQDSARSPVFGMGKTSEDDG